MSERVSSTTGELALFARKLRRLVLEQSRRANVGHVGSALSIADLLAVCIGGRLDLEGGPDRDRFILSKGHAALALYAALHLRGILSAAELDTYCADGTSLGVHPEAGAKGIDFGTGSLGHGLSIGAGAALAARLQGSARRVYALLSDAECNEGSVWEAVMFAAHHRLDNLTAMVDVNGQQALGKTADVLSLAPLEERWRSFGWDVTVTPGNDVDAIDGALAAFERRPGRPHVLLAQTVFGHPVSFMRGRIEWHYLPLDEAGYATALAEVDGGAAAPVP